MRCGLSPAGPEFDGAVVTAFSPDGRLLDGGGADGVLRLWNLAEPAGTATVHAHDGPVRHLAFAPDGTLIATGGEDDLVRRWNPQTLAPVGAPLPGPGGAVAFLPTDGTLLTGDGDGRVQRWNARTGEPLGQPFGDRPTMPPTLGGYQPHRDADTTVESITASPDGRRVATRHENSGVGLWDPDSGASLLPKWPGLAGAVAVVPGSDLLYVGGHLYHLDGPPHGS
jgi:WD40 repeat protein